MATTSALRAKHVVFEERSTAARGHATSLQMATDSQWTGTCENVLRTSGSSSPSETTEETSLRRHSFCSTDSCDSGIDVNAPEELDVDSECLQHGGILKRSRPARSLSPSKRRRRVSFHPSVLLWATAHSGDYDSFFDILIDAHANRTDSEDKRRSGIEGLLLHTPDRQGITLLHLCCFSGSIKCVRLLLALGGDTSVADDDGWTPLHAAAAGGHIDIVHVMVAAGADLEATDCYGRTPFDVASNYVTKACLELYCLKFDDTTVPSRPASRISDV